MSITKKPVPESRLSLPLAPAILLGVLACAIGAVCTWAFLSSSKSDRSTNQVLDYASTPAAPALPDVSQLAPGPAAVALGNWQYDHNNWAAAIAHYQQAISFGIDNADLRTDLGNAFRFNSNAPEALKQYAIARRQNPGHENSLLNTASLHAEVLHDNAKAIELWREFLRRFPNSAAVLQVRKSLAEVETRSSFSNPAMPDTPGFLPAAGQP